MPEDSKGRAFPDVSAKLSALPKKSLFERQKAEAEAKRAREQAETAAVYEDFVKSFDDDTTTGPRTQETRPQSFGGRGGGMGGGPTRRHFTSSGPRNSGPGSLGPPPQSLSRKRTHEGFVPRNRDSTYGVLGFDNASTGLSGPPPGFRSPSDDDADRRADEKEAEKAAAKPTLYLASLPPGTSPSALKALIPSYLTVDNVNILRPPSHAPTDKKSSAAIITLSGDSAASDIDSAVSALQNKYLGRGYYLTLSRHLSSAAISSNISTTVSLSSTSSMPFGAKNVQPNFGGSLNRAPPPGTHRGFAPPSSYAPTAVHSGPSMQVEVTAPSDIKQLRLIHKTLENLLNHGPEFEALLMSRSEVQRDEKWAWLWDARSPGGVYYRWKLWQIVTNPRNHRRTKTQPSSAIFDGGVSWVPPKHDIMFEYTTNLDEFVSDADYNSSDEERSDGEDERRNFGGAPPLEGVNGQYDGLGYMNPLQKAKLTHLLARMPTTHAKLRRGDITRLTAFAIQHAGAGADEVVDMIVLNILSPLAYAGANPDRELEKNAANTENGNSKGRLDNSAAKLVGLYIISDILSSSATSGVRHAWRYRQLFESALCSHKVFEHLGRLEKDLHWGRMRAEKWKRSLENLLHLWEGWCVFPQSSQEHFLQVFQHPPLTEEEMRKEKEKEKTEERASHVFSKGKSRWKTVDEDPSQNVRGNGLAQTTEQNHSTPRDVAGYEPMGDIDGVPMEDSDLEDAQEARPIEETPGDELKKAPAMQPEPFVQADAESASRQPRKPRPKAEDMFALDSD